MEMAARVELRVFLGCKLCMAVAVAAAVAAADV